MSQLSWSYGAEVCVSCSLGLLVFLSVDVPSFPTSVFTLNHQLSTTPPPVWGLGPQASECLQGPWPLLTDPPLISACVSLSLSLFWGHGPPIWALTLPTFILLFLIGGPQASHPGVYVG